MASPYLRTQTIQNAITIVFHPPDSKVASDCAKIVNIQFLRILGDGKALKPGTYAPNFAFRDAVTTDAFWCIDFLDGETTPDYQQNNGQEGYINIAGSKDASMYDGPVAVGGYKRFYDPDKNPDGWKTVVYEFFTYAWCMASSGSDGQCDTWYEAISWTYSRDWEDAKNDRPGLAKIGDDNIAPPIKEELLAAFVKFNDAFGFVPCKKTENAGGIS